MGKKCLSVIVVLFLPLISRLFSACDVSAQPSPVSDSTETVVVLPLPDTAFASTGNIVFQVDVFDSITDGTIASFDNLYASAPGIFLFRGTPFRDGSFYGTVEGTPDTVIVDWTFVTHFDKRVTPQFGAWGGGTGWSGQPIFVRWPDSCMARFRKESPAILPSFSSEEIIVGSLASRLYFINFQTGDSSRKSLNTYNTIKGTVSLDPTLNGNLYVGQGVPCTYPFGAMVVNLYKHKISHFFPQDKSAWRHWGAYDSSPIRVDRFLIRPGENGTVYKFLIVGDSLRLHSTLKFKLPGRGAAGMEASMAVYRNYGFISDNHGNIVCVNLSTMRPVWHYGNHDDSDSSPLFSIENDVPYLYSACEVDKQGSYGKCYFVKLNALTGEKVWEQKFPARRVTVVGQTFDGGAFASPLLGCGNCDSLIFINVVTNEMPGMKGDFVAMRKSDGHVVYSTRLKQYAWSSPVGLLNSEGTMFVFNADTHGNVYLIDGLTGRILYTSHIGDNFESSPIVIDNHIVLGSRGRNIYKMTVK